MSKSGSSGSDTGFVSESAALIVLIPALASFVSILCLYSVYAHVIRQETRLHDLRQRVETLHHHQVMHLARLKGELEDEEPGEVEIIDDETGEPVGVELDQDRSTDQSSAAKAA